MVSLVALRPTTGLCVRCGIRIPSARNHSPAFAKDKCLEPMFGDVGQARTNAAMLLLMIDTTSSRTCTKPTVVRRNILLIQSSFFKITLEISGFRFR